MEAMLKRRMWVYGLLSLALIVIIYVFMNDPGGYLYRLTGKVNSLRISGLVVYSSIVAFALFLFLVILRYFLLLIAAYLNTVRHTVRAAYDEGFTPPVSVIVPAYNEGILLEDTVQSLLSMDYPEYEIILVDDGSTDNTREIARSLVGVYDKGRVEVRLVEKSNGGKSTALNAGIKVSKYDFVLNVDGDSRLSPNTLRKTVRHFTNARIGAVAGNVKVLNRVNFWTTLQALEYVQGLNMARSAQSILRLVNIIPGPLGLFRKAAIIDAGWYASDTYAEDADLTLQILRKGWRVEYEPDALSYTEAPDTLVALLKQRYRWTRGILQAIRKHQELVFNPTINISGTFVMWTMAFEALIGPVMGMFAPLYFIFIALTFDMSYFIVLWWLSLTTLDVIAALYCVAVEKEEVRLIFYSLISRVVFVLFIDIAKTFATIEEFLRLSMDWGKLERVGSEPQSR
jgi:biofilm PGA synthesis N-glycosyltransferase PgaC